MSKSESERWHVLHDDVCERPSHLAAIKAPKIMENTVSLIEVENVFLWGIKRIMVC